MSREISELGKRYGLLRVVARLEPDGKGALWRLRCKCGGEIDRRGFKLRQDPPYSCGCTPRPRA